MPRILAAVLQTQTAKDIKSDAAARPPAFRSFFPCRLHHHHHVSSHIIIYATLSYLSMGLRAKANFFFNAAMHTAETASGQGHALQGVSALLNTQNCLTEAQLFVSAGTRSRERDPRLAPRCIALPSARFRLSPPSAGSRLSRNRGNLLKTLTPTTTASNSQAEILNP